MLQNAFQSIFIIRVSRGIGFIDLFFFFFTRLHDEAVISQNFDIASSE